MYIAGKVMNSTFCQCFSIFRIVLVLLTLRNILTPRTSHRVVVVVKFVYVASSACWYHKQRIVRTKCVLNRISLTCNSCDV